MKRFILNLLAVPRRLIVSIIKRVISNKSGVIILYDDPERSKVFKLIKEIKKENEMVLRDNEAYQIFMAVKRTAKVKGEIAEVGVYKGSSAKLICEAKGNKILHLFDTFEGLPNISNEDDPKQFQKGDYSATLENVKKYLVNYQNVNLYKGIFPSSAASIKNVQFSFVHLDLDLYESTLESLQFFYPRISKGGVIISHDYIDAKGVRKAFDEFFQDKVEPIIEMSGSQCLIVKT